MGKVLQAITGSTKRIVGIMAHDFQRVFTNPLQLLLQLVLWCFRRCMPGLIYRQAGTRMEVRTIYP